MGAEDRLIKFSFKCEFYMLGGLAKKGKGSRLGSGGISRGMEVGCRGKRIGRQKTHRGRGGARIARRAPVVPAVQNIFTGKLI